MLTKLYNACWYLVGGLILLAAVGITIIRLLLPGIDEYRESIEDMVSQYSGYPIQIEGVSAEWQGWQPQLHLRNVTLLAPKNGRRLAGFESASISFSLLASLWQQKPIPETLIISGARLKLIHTREGSIRFTDQRFDSAAGDNNMQSELGRWLLGQSLIHLEDARLLVVDENSQRPPLRLNKAELKLRSWRERIQIDGHALLPEHYGKSIRFAIDVNGNLLGRDWSGRMYADVEAIKLSAWPQYSRWQDLNLRAGTTNLRVWSHWQQSRLHQATGTIELEDMLIRGHGHSNLIRELAADFHLQRNAANWQLNARINRLLTWNGVWPVTDIAISARSNHGDMTVNAAYISQLQIADIFGLSGLKTQLGNRVYENIGEPYGELKQLYFQRYDDGQWQLSGRLHNLGTIADANRDRFSGLDAEFAFNQQRGRIQLNSDAFSLADSALLATPVNDLSINGQLDWYRQDAGVLLQTNGLYIDTRPHRLNLRGQMLWEADSKPRVDLLAALSGGDVEALKRFIPEPAKDKLKNWLRQGILGGKLEHAGMVLRGDLDDFPFKQQQGQFKIEASFSDINMEYDEEWPPIYQVDGDLTIEQDKLTARVPEALMYEARLHDARAVIADLFAEDHLLQVQGQASGATANAIRFLENSPLRERDAIKRLLELELAGELDMALDMDITLYPEGKDRVSGEVRLLDNHIVSSRLNLTLEQVNGYVMFDGDEINSRDLEARYHQTPVDLEIRRADGDEQPIRLSMHGRADPGLIKQVLTDKVSEFDTAILDDRLQGSSQWQVDIIAQSGKSGSETLHISSGLQGLAIDLPAPLGKQASEERSLQMTFDLARNNPATNDFELNYADTLSARYAHNGLAIALGNGRIPTPRADTIIVHGQTAMLDLDAWLDLLEQELPATTSPTTAMPGTVELDLEAGTLTLYDQDFADVRMMLQREATDWQLRFAGADISGYVSLPHSLPAGTVSANFDRLRLDAVTAEEDQHTDSRFDPLDFPALAIEIRDFTYGDSALGQFNLSASRTQQGLAVDKVRFNKPGLSIVGNGKWEHIGSEILSRFNLDLKADRMNDMLSTFGYTDETVSGGKTNIEIDARWPGSPMSFSLARMNGSLTLDIRDGQFLDINPKAGRLFGLLSIQTLPRRLSLDFKDLFGKGFAFDRISGSFTIDNGSAHTSDLTMEGPAALITVAGHTNLVEQTYDQIVTVIPQVSDSLPVAGALFGPIGIGVGAAIFLTGQVFESIPDQIDRLLGYQYRVTGSWSDPVVTPVGNEQETRTPLLPNTQPVQDNPLGPGD